MNIKSLIQLWIGTLVRHGLTALAGYLLAEGVVDAVGADKVKDLDDVVVSAILFVFTIGWSAVQKYFHHTDQNGDSPKYGGILKMIFIPFAVLFFSSCAIVAPFDQASLDTDIAIKSDALNLMSHATEDHAIYDSQINSLKIYIDSTIAKENGKGVHNFAIEKQWDILMSTDHLLGKILKDWQAGKTFSQTFIDEEKILIGDAFDQIIQSESSKEHK